MSVTDAGTYRVHAPVVRISVFASVLKVIDSKQHPRKLKIHGSDGHVYGFLLKGHEDLRQDERVMQLFGLVSVFVLVVLFWIHLFTLPLAYAFR